MSASVLEPKQSGKVELNLTIPSRVWRCESELATPSQRTNRSRTSPAAQAQSIILFFSEIQK